MKKGLIVSFILILFASFTIVSAATCSDNQTIMRLNLPTNSHVSFWNQDVATYTNEICFDNIFGVPYSGSNPHTCTGGNRILSLSDISNAHASSTKDANYPNDVCYGELGCTYDTSAGNSCSNGGEIVARMYSGYNTHVSDTSDISYTTKICCVTSNIYWADMDGNSITNADFGDTVQMIKTGSASGDFDIKERDIIFDDDIRTVSGVLTGSRIVGVWTITQGDMDQTEAGDYDQFYFTINGQDSGDLNINIAGSNTPINVTLISPSCGVYLNEGTNVDISVLASDEDDEINGSISVNGNIVSNFSNNGIVFSNTFNSSGNSQIMVRTVNNRGESSRAISNIMVLERNASGYIDREYVATCISKPKDFSNIQSSIVEFDASTTRAIRITNGILDELIPDDGDVFSWYWTFMPENIIRNYINSTNSFAYRFSYQPPIAGDNSASLRVEI